MCLVYLQRKLRQDSYVWCIFKVKISKNIFTEKEWRNKVALMILHVKVFTQKQQLRLSILSMNTPNTIYAFRV